MSKHITSRRKTPLEVGEDYEMGFTGKIPLIGDVMEFRNITLKRTWQVRVVQRWQDRKRFSVEVLKELDPKE